MRCHNVRAWLSAHPGLNSSSPEALEVREHLKECSSCQSLEQHERKVETMLSTTAPKVPPVPAASISTASIMQAIQQQKRISQQLEDIQQQQQMRMSRMKAFGAASAALGFFTLSSIPLLFLAITIIQTDLALKTLTLLNDFIDILIIIGQYLQVGLIMLTRDNWLLSGMAFIVVIMMGMWLRLMRPPREA